MDNGRSYQEKIGAIIKKTDKMETAEAVFVCCVDFKRLQIAGVINDTTIVADTTENVIVGTTNVAIFAQILAIAAMVFVTSVESATAQKKFQNY